VFDVPSFQEALDVRHGLCWKEQFVGAGVLIALGLDYNMTWSKPHSVRNRLFMAAV
jgi:hypothetical protein